MLKTLRSKEIAGPRKWRYRNLLITLRILASPFGVSLFFVGSQAISAGIAGIQDVNKAHSHGPTLFIALVITGAAMLIGGAIATISPMMRNSQGLLGINIFFQFGTFCAFLGLYLAYDSATEEVETSLFGFAVKLMPVLLGFGLAAGIGGIVNTALLIVLKKKDEAERRDSFLGLCDPDLLQTDREMTAGNIADDNILDTIRMARA